MLKFQENYDDLRALPHNPMESGTPYPAVVEPWQNASSDEKAKKETLPLGSGLFRVPYDVPFRGCLPGENPALYPAVRPASQLRVNGWEAPN
jgi:hypothetical protein